MKSLKLILVFMMISTLVCSQKNYRLSLPITHTSKISDLYFTTDGKKLISGSQDMSAKIWDVETGFLLAENKLHNNTVEQVRILDKLQWTITAENEEVMLWSPFQAERPIHYFKNLPPTNILSSPILAISHSNKHLAIATESGTIQLYDILKPDPIRTLQMTDGGNFSLKNIQFHKSDSMLMAFGSKGELNVWNYKSGKLLKQFTKNQTAIIYDAGFSENGTYLYYSCLDKDTRIVRVYTTDGFAPFFGVGNPQLRPSILKVNDTHHYIAIGTDEGIVNVWDMKQKKNLLTDKIHSNQPIKALHFSSDGKAFTAISSTGIITSWNLQSGSIIETHHINEGKITASASSKDIIAFGFSTGNIVLWNGIEGRLHKKFDTKIASANVLLRSIEKNKLFIGGGNGNAMFWNLEDASLHTIPGKHKRGINQMLVTKEEKYIITSSYDSTLCIREKKEEAYIPTSIPLSSEAATLLLSPDKKYLLVFTMTSDEMYKIDLATKRVERRISFNKNLVGYINQAIFVNDTIIAMAVTGKAIHFYHVQTGELLNGIPIRNKAPFSIQYNAKYNVIAAVLSDGTMALYNLFNFKEVASHRFEQKISTIYFDDDLETMYCFSDNKLYYTVPVKASLDKSNFKLQQLPKSGEVKLIDIKRDEVIISNNETVHITQFSKSQYFSLVAADSTTFFAVNDEGYYKSTSNAGKLLFYVSDSLDIISFEQLDLIYNRPDKLLQAIPGSDSSLAKSYQLAYEKRLQKLGISRNALQVKELLLPEASLQLINQNGNLAEIKVLMHDKQNGLTNWNVWVNGVPLFGNKGNPITGNRKRKMDTVFSLNLSAGLNRIEVGVRNKSGLESLRKPIFLKSSSLHIEQKMVFIGIGIDDYQQSEFNLNWSVKDIRDLASVLKHKFPALIIDTIFNKNATKRNILALKSKLNKLNENDRIIFAYSGHGILNRQYDYFLSTYDVQFDAPEQLGFSYTDLENLLDNILPREKLILIDACHSGEVDKDELEKIKTVSNSLSNNITARSSIKISTKKKIGIRNSFELMNELFTNINRGNGATVISAAAGTQFALEQGDLQNGVFTYCIIDAFRQNSSLTISQLKEIVTQRVSALTKGLQKPTSRTETIYNDWRVW